MRLIRLALALALVTALLGAPSVGAEVKMKRLGEDVALDAPPALDLTYVEVGRNGDDLEIRIGISGMLPGIGGYPALPGIEWQFKAGKRQFLAEAYVGTTRGTFLLFEYVDDVYERRNTIEGTYDWNDGYISMLVPLKEIDAKAGMKIKGAGENDADSHVHGVVTSEYTDYLTTTKAFKIPKS